MENRVGDLEARVTALEEVIEKLTTSHHESAADVSVTGAGLPNVAVVDQNQTMVDVTGAADSRLPNVAVVDQNQTTVDNLAITTAVKDLNTATVSLPGEGQGVAGALRTLNQLLLVSPSAVQVALDAEVTTALLQCLTSESSDERDGALLCVKTVFAAQPKGNEQLLPIVAVLIKHIKGKVFSSLEEQRSVLGHIEALAVIAFQSKEYQIMCQAEGAVTALSRMIMPIGIGGRDSSVYQKAIMSLKVLMKASDPTEAQGWVDAVMRHSIDSNAKLSWAIEWVLVHLLAFPQDSIRVSSNAIVILLNCLECDDVFLRREAIWMLRVAGLHCNNYKEKILASTKFHELSSNLLSTATIDVKKKVAELLHFFCLSEKSKVVVANLRSMVGSLQGFIELAKIGWVGNDAAAIGMGLGFIRMVTMWVPDGPNLIEKNGGLDVLIQLQEKNAAAPGKTAKSLIDTYFPEAAKRV